MDQETLTSQDGRTIIILRPDGRLDITTAWQFRLRLQDCMNQDANNQNANNQDDQNPDRKGPHLVVNLSQVNFIDSSGLTSLVAGMRDADKVNGSFRLCSVHPEAKLVFEVTMMDSVFEIFDSEEEALNRALGSLAG